MKYVKSSINTVKIEEVYLCSVMLATGKPCSKTCVSTHEMRRHYGLEHAARSIIANAFDHNAPLHAYLDNEEDHKALSNAYHVVGRWDNPGWYEVDRDGETITPLFRVIDDTKQEIVRLSQRLKDLRQLSRKQV